MASNIFCAVAAIWTAYLVFDGFRKGSILVKGGRRVHRDSSPFFFHFLTLFYSVMVIFFTSLPFMGIDIFDR